MISLNRLELKQCPFCGGSPRRITHWFNDEKDGSHRIYYVVKCTQCSISQPKRKYFSRNESDTAWNSRLNYPDDSMKEVLLRLFQNKSDESSIPNWQKRLVEECRKNMTDDEIQNWLKEI